MRFDGTRLLAFQMLAWLSGCVPDLGEYRFIPGPDCTQGHGWSPAGSKSTEVQSGVRFDDGPVPVDVGMRLEIIESEAPGSLKLRACKISADLPEFANSINVQFVESRFQTVMFNGPLAADGVCTSFGELKNESNYSNDQILDGSWRIVSPDSSSGEWTLDCERAGASPPGGFCWHGRNITPTMTRICGSDTPCSGGVCVEACGDDACVPPEDPASCLADCEPRLISGPVPSKPPHGDCQSKDGGWHPGDGIVLWTFGTSCPLPSPMTPTMYESEFGSWRFDVRAAGFYDVLFKIPPQGPASCNFPITAYTSGARYMLINGSAHETRVVNQRSNEGTEVVVFSNVHLLPGELTLYLYDSVTDLEDCCDKACSQSHRVFLDYAEVSWVGP